VAGGWQHSWDARTTTENRQAGSDHADACICLWQSMDCCGKNNQHVTCCDNILAGTAACLDNGLDQPAHRSHLLPWRWVTCTPGTKHPPWAALQRHPAAGPGAPRLVPGCGQSVWLWGPCTAAAGPGTWLGSAAQTLQRTGGAGGGGGDQVQWVCACVANTGVHTRE
jgi:hypothetical protein